MAIVVMLRYRTVVLSFSSARKEENADYILPSKRRRKYAIRYDLFAYTNLKVLTSGKDRLGPDSYQS